MPPEKRSSEELARGSEKESTFMRGRVVSGLGQSQYFLSQDEYQRQFIELLGFVPAAGTLNVLLEGPIPPEAPQILIRGFSKAGKSFGGCRCYKIKFRGIDAAALRPEMSSHPPEMIEIIAPVNLRRALDLKDGDEVSLMLR